VDLRLLRRISSTILDLVLGQTVCELSIVLVDTAEISRINKTFLNHEGPTDVITFDYSDEDLCGEILICMDEAISQAEVFGTTWQTELVRYVIHGVLHLHGHKDHAPALRRKMKREEDGVLRQLARSFDLHKL
jgi:probable rRNA maturation factor